MSRIHALVLGAHIIAGVVGLFAFWVPVVARKGRGLHARAGRVFLLCCYVVVATALGLSALDLTGPLRSHPGAAPTDPETAFRVAAVIRGFAVFLAYLAVVTLASAYHGARVIQARGDVSLVRTPLHTALHTLAIAASSIVFAMGATRGNVLFMAMSPIGVLVGAGGLRYPSRPLPTPLGYWYEHMGAMLGAGIAFHTAFATGGLGRFLSLAGPLALLPWLLPALIGTPAIFFWTRHYRTKLEGPRLRTGHRPASGLKRPTTETG